MTLTQRRAQGTLPIGEAVASLMRDGMPVRFTAYDGSSAGPEDAAIELELVNQRGLSYLLTAPGDLGMARAYVSGDLNVNGVHPGDPYDARNHVHEYRLKSGRKIYVLGEGRLVNLAAAEGHPPSVMDMSFATQALTTEYCIKNKGKLGNKVHEVPVEVEQYVSRHKLDSMGIKLDELTTEQKRYMSGWEQGT